MEKEVKKKEKIEKLEREEKISVVVPCYNEQEVLHYFYND